MQIKTLAEILAESESDSASLSVSKKKSLSNSNNRTDSNANNYPRESKVEYQTPDDQQSSDTTMSNDFFTTRPSSKIPNKKTQKRNKRFHPAANFTAEPSDAPTYQPPQPQSIKEMLAEVKREVHDDNNTDSNILSESDNHADNLPSALKAYLRSPEQRQAEVDAIKAESRLRWLAFYYLSRREYGKAELRQKLLDKEQDPDKTDALLDEFESKGYQSDYRTTLMLIRESIRKGRGRGHIKQEFYRKKIDMPSNIDELIDMANEESDEFREFIDDSEDSLIEGIDWLKLAVTARTKKYGENIPIEQKDKARQLRFLQYRGFDTDICFQALNYTLDNLDERF
ncbi:regulatory protein RecX [Psychrobacter urativorans]|uniref:Regulatory protein RecX n=1 Tax=Psychrobacter urativorans TaxID=45610 RepID=A0A0M3V8K5_9GAMM|nr:regulatory protein RecX [Psychrobacter urativorans]ALF59343.1 inhibitor/regulator of recA, recX [Psychrobacter urativorans]